MEAARVLVDPVDLSAETAGRRNENLHIPKHYQPVREVALTAKDLLDFELSVKEEYERATITGPVHLSKGNEEALIEIFQYVPEDAWVFSSWRNHYHALLHGMSSEALFELILAGKSMSVHSTTPRFYASSIVAGILPIAVGTAAALKRQGSSREVWAFIGDMTAETGIFHEAYKYARGFDLPIHFVVEDNNMSTNTPTDASWGGEKSKHPEDVFYYRYERGYPHHGTGQWILF